MQGSFAPGYDKEGGQGKGGEGEGGINTYVSALLRIVAVSLNFLLIQIMIYLFAAATLLLPPLPQAKIYAYHVSRYYVKK